MKKAFKIIFSLYFIALAMMPCYDKEECSSAKIEIAQVTQHEEEAPDICTPFCICSCCVTFFMHTNPVSDLKVIATINSSYTAFLHPKVTSVSIPVWQPPKVA